MKIYALDTNTNTMVQTTTTDANGNYTLSNLAAGGNVADGIPVLGDEERDTDFTHLRRQRRYR